MTGQVCSSLTRIVVTRDRHDDLVEALSESFSQVKVGSAFDPESSMGPLAMQRQRDRVEGYIAKGVDEGATWPRGATGRAISTGAGSSSRPSSETSTTRPPSPKRRSSGRS